MRQLQEVGVSQLSPWEENPRHNEDAVEAVLKSIKAFGFNSPILCDTNFKIIAGHTRWMAAQRLGLKTVPVIALDMSEQQRRAYAIADNKTAEIAKWDFPKLRDILEELRAEDVELGDLGFSDDELRRLLKPKGIDENEVPSTPTDPMTKNGDLWILGNHRLLCGDSRDSETVAKLLDGNRVDHVFGGPPYFNQRQYAQWSTYEEYLSDMKAILEVCRDSLMDGGVLVWNIANECSSHRDLTSNHSSLLESVGMTYLDTIVWYKTQANYLIPRNFHIRRNGRYYPAFQWEALLVFQKAGEMPKMSKDAVEYMSEHHTNVWEIPAITKQAEKFGHPAVCPVEIPYRSMLAYSGKDANVLEPFGGSGTTLIAAEKARHHSFLMEQHPIYCDQIVKRWEAYTGEKARKA